MLTMPPPLSRDEVRDVDRRTIEEFGLPGLVLMENAGRGTADLLLEQIPHGRVVVCAGKGNNGGDGFVVARHLENRGCDVRVLVFHRPEEYHGDAATNLHVLQAAGTPLRVFESPIEPEDLTEELAAAEWVVDALLGTGTQGEVREPFGQVIEAVNGSGARILAVDLPSGLDCDTGEPLGPCVRADLTATFVAPKRGFTGDGAERYTGAVHVVDIGAPRAALPF